jgi:predicted nucleotidyltransferase component of viral defense system
VAFQDIYKKQVQLLVRSLPYVAEEDCFALKGGTAINMFVRNLPRLSVDIDLTYLPEADREHALTEIGAALTRIAARIKQADSTIHISASAPGTQTTINKIVLRAKNQVQIKIEVTPVLRGCVYKPKVTTIVEKAEDEFGFAEINVLSFADLYAGKIMAALDRQHPRDLFDVSLLMNSEGITDDLRKAVVVYLISHDHSPHSLLSPQLKDVAHEYETNFIGMTEGDLPLEILLDARITLIEDVLGNMPDAHKKFLISFYMREPEWELLGLDGVEDLPAIRWRELNLDKAGKETREALVRKLVEVL